MLLVTDGQEALAVVLLIMAQVALEYQEKATQAALDFKVLTQLRAVAVAVKAQWEVVQRRH